MLGRSARPLFNRGPHSPPPPPSTTSTTRAYSSPHPSLQPPTPAQLSAPANTIAWRVLTRQLDALSPTTHSHTLTHKPNSTLHPPPPPPNYSVLVQGPALRVQEVQYPLCGSQTSQREQAEVRGIQPEVGAMLSLF